MTEKRHWLLRPEEKTPEGIPIVRSHQPAPRPPQVRNDSPLKKAIRQLHAGDDLPLFSVARQSNPHGKDAITDEQFFSLDEAFDGGQIDPRVLRFRDLSPARWTDEPWKSKYGKYCAAWDRWPAALTSDLPDVPEGMFSNPAQSIPIEVMSNGTHKRCTTWILSLRPGLRPLMARLNAASEEYAGHLMRVLARTIELSYRDAEQLWIRDRVKIIGAILTDERDHDPYARACYTESQRFLRDFRDTDEAKALYSAYYALSQGTRAIVIYQSFGGASTECLRTRIGSGHHKDGAAEYPFWQYLRPNGKSARFDLAFPRLLHMALRSQSPLDDVYAWGAEFINIVVGGPVFGDWDGPDDERKALWDYAMKGAREFKEVYDELFGVLRRAHERRSSRASK